MKTLTCMIVDDEPLAVKMLEDFVSRTPYLRLAASFNDPVLALSTLCESPVDVLFLDIQMPDLDGLNLSRMVPPSTRVIFTTAFKEYAFDSYEVNALDFLLKPIRYHKFLGAAEKARQWFEMNRRREAAFSCGWIAVAAGGNLPDIIRDGLEGLRDDLSGRGGPSAYHPRDDEGYGRDAVYRSLYAGTSFLYRGVG